MMTLRLALMSTLGNGVPGAFKTLTKILVFSGLGGVKINHILRVPSEPWTQQTPSSLAESERSQHFLIVNYQTKREKWKI